MAQWAVTPTLALVVVQVYSMKIVLLLHGMAAWPERIDPHIVTNADSTLNLAILFSLCHSL